MSSKNLLFWLATAVVFAGAIHLSTRLLSTDVRHQDIYWIYKDGQQILNGKNTYSRIRNGDMRKNQKYATFFPLFYCLSAASQIPFPEFQEWVQAWRIVFVLFNLGIGAVFLALGVRQECPWGGLLAAGIWFFNRWTIAVIGIGQIDFVPIFFAVLSVILFPSRRKASLYLLGVSLAIKQIAIFLCPLYVIWCWHEEENPVELGKDMLRLISIPLIVSIPFLIWDAKGMILSILFSATRNPTGHFGAPSLDQVHQLVGLPAKIPMLAAMAGTYWLAYKRMVGRIPAAFLIILCFTLFNSVLFRQYLLWPMAFLVPWLLDELARNRPRDKNAPAETTR